MNGAVKGKSQSRVEPPGSLTRLNDDWSGFGFQSRAESPGSLTGCAKFGEYE